MSDAAIAGLLAEALRELFRHVDERPVDDDVADDDVRALESDADAAGGGSPQRPYVSRVLGQ